MQNLLKLLNKPLQQAKKDFWLVQIKKKGHHAWLGGDRKSTSIGDLKYVITN